eukprot:898034-Amphidinium_carterae.1
MTRDGKWKMEADEHGGLFRNTKNEKELHFKMNRGIYDRYDGACLWLITIEVLLDESASAGGLFVDHSASADNSNSASADGPVGDHSASAVDELANAGDPDETMGEAQTPVARRKTNMPSALEKREHELAGHQPHRSWCRECMRGRGRAQGHPTNNTKKSTTPKLSIDFKFLGRGDGQMLTILCAHDASTQRIMGTVVPSKESHPYTVAWLHQQIRIT